MEPAECTQRVEELLADLRHKGATLWTENGQLRYQARRGVLTSADFSNIRALKDEICLYLVSSGQEGLDELPLRARANGQTVPLTFSQAWLWNAYHLQRSSYRTVSTAIRIRDSLCVPTLQRALTWLISRHQSLRTQIVMFGSIPIQDIAESLSYELQVLDMTNGLENDRLCAAGEIIKRQIATPFDLVTDPIFTANLIKLGPGDHILMVALDHLFADDTSLQVLLTELFAVYFQLERGLSPTLPPIRVHFPDYAVWQRQPARYQAASRREYWQHTLGGAKRLRVFSGDAPREDERCYGRPRYVPVALGAELSASLRRFSRTSGTTLPMSMLCAYVALLSRWCEASDIVVPFISMGRVHPELQTSIGYFASPLFLRINIRDDDSLASLLERIVGIYAQAVEQYDFGELVSGVSLPEFEPNASFNWVPPEYVNIAADLTGIARGESAQTLRFESFDLGNPLEYVDWGIEWDREPALYLSDTNGEVIGTITYIIGTAPHDVVSRFARNYQMLCRLLTTQPATRLRTIACVS
jgi:hypothetical protein